MRIERRLFIDVKSHWSYVCILSEKLMLSGWNVTFRPELNAIDIVKFRYDGLPLEDNMKEIVNSVDGTKGVVRTIYDLSDDMKMTRWIE